MTCYISPKQYLPAPLLLKVIQIIDIHAYQVLPHYRVELLAIGLRCLELLHCVPADKGFNIGPGTLQARIFLERVVRVVGELDYLRVVVKAEEQVLVTDEARRGQVVNVQGAIESPFV